jgi:hypothetical protein
MPKFLLVELGHDGSFPYLYGKIVQAITVRGLFLSVNMANFLTHRHGRSLA